ncbi:alpha/beta hydrolase [Microbacterium sp. 1P10UB]|uniref:alpha/beta fold hydrolase n=1 Tax=unclassified Microbacterium TaxID=2609290 RepID=UPI0039A2B52E
MGDVPVLGGIACLGQAVRMSNDARPVSHLHVGETVQIEYIDEGPTDGPVVVLLHGYPDIPATWDAVVGMLPPGLRIIRPCLRGVGLTRIIDPRARSGQVAALASDVRELLCALDLRDVVLVGHDWGARAAHAAAVLEPELFRGLITLSTAYGDGRGLTAEQSLADVSVAWYRYWLCTERGAAAFRADPAALTRWAWRHWSPSVKLTEHDLEAILTATDTDEFADDVVHYYRHGAGEADGAPLYADTQAHLDAWPRIRVPATFLIGTADGCETLAPARANGHLFDAERTLIELDGVGHFIQREQPRAVVDAIVSHLRQPQTD